MIAHTIHREGGEGNRERERLKEASRDFHASDKRKKRTFP